MNKKIFWSVFFTLICILGLTRGLWVGVSEDSDRIYDDDLYILTNDESFFPPDILRQIEYRLNSHIFVKKYQGLGDLEQILVASTEYSLIFGPRQMLATLNNQNFLENIDTQINKYITRDFINFNTNNLSYFFPVFWNFYVFTEGQTPVKASDKKWLSMPEDLDFIYTFIKKKTGASINQENPFEIFEKYNLKVLNPKSKNPSGPSKIDSAYNIHTNVSDDTQIYLNSKEFIYLKEYGFSIIREKKNRALSYAFIQAYIHKSYQRDLIPKLRIASTLSIAENLEIENRQKPSYIRKKIPLTKLHRIDKAPVEWEEIYNN